MDGLSRDLVRAQDGDGEAFARVIGALHGEVVRFCAWFVGSPQDAHDLAQEAFLRAFRGVRTYRGEAPARQWIMSIARRTCLDHVARAAADRRRDESLAPLSRTADAHDVAGVEMSDVLAALQPEFREAFVLVRLHGFTYAEAARIMECPRGTVQSRVARARLALAAALADDGGEPALRLGVGA